MTRIAEQTTRKAPILLIIFAAGITFIGCRIADKESKTATTMDEAKPAPSSPKPKLLIQREKKGTETGVYQQHFKIVSPVKVNSEVISGNHKIELTNMATYPGGVPKCVASSLVMNVLHEKPDKGGWQFSNSPKVSWVVDGQTTHAVKVLTHAIEFEDGNYWETVIAQPTCQTFEQLGNGKVAEIHIDDAVVEFTQYDLDAFKEFASALGLQR